MNATDEVMTRYLLGQLNDQESRKFEESFFCDDEVFDALMVAEGELIEAYLQDELPDEQRLQFERQLKASPKRRSRVETARLLAAEAHRTRLGTTGSNGGGSTTSGATSHKGSAMAGADFPVGKPGRRTLYRALPAAACLIMALTTGWLWWGHHNLRQELGVARHEQENLGHQLTRTAAQLDQVSRPASLLIDIRPATRGAGRREEWRLPADPKEVTLEILLPQNGPEFARYDTRLIHETTEREWRHSGIEATPQGDRLRLTLKYAASDLPAGEYTLLIDGSDGDRSAFHREIYLNAIPEEPQP